MTTTSNLSVHFETFSLNAFCYNVKIPITDEGLLINIGPPNKHFEKFMPLHTCIFLGYRKFSNGSTGDVEKQQLIHEIGDWIIKVEDHPTENLSFFEVKDLMRTKILENKNKKVDEIQLTFASVSHLKKKVKLEKDRVKKKLQRAYLSEEKKEEIKERDKVRHQMKRSIMSANFSEEKLEEIKEKDRVRHQMKRSIMSIDEKEKEKERARKRKILINQTEQQIEEERLKSRQRYDKKMMNQRQELEHTLQISVERNSFPTSSRITDGHNFDLINQLHIENSLKLCSEKIRRTLLQPNELGYRMDTTLHQSLVCVVCDHFIIGTQVFHWIKAISLQFHSNILSSSYFYKEGMNPILKEQYRINHPLLCNLLLSPRARRDIVEDSFLCCQCCYDDLYPCKRKTCPPKFAISNGFAIGFLPEEISRGVTPVVNNLVAPVRAFNYFLSFSSSKEQRVTGNFTFFSQDVSENIGALHHTGTNNNNPSIYVILSGSFTPLQLEKIRKQGCYSCETFENIYSFLHANNKHYSSLPSLNNIPRPVVEEICINESEICTESENQNCNKEPICWKFWFPNIEDPDRVHGSFGSQSEFAKALWIGETPTLIYHPSKIVNQATLSQLCPIAFPFGTGDVNEKRKPSVSEIECLQHYLKLSLPQFQEGQFILIIHHIYQRKKSFLSGITKCNTSNNGTTIADQLSEITASELDEVITQMKKRQQSNDHTGISNVSSNISQFLRCIKTSCTPIGYTSEAASDARMKMFALWMTFSSPSLLFTFSPCDECSFKMHLYATGKQVALPHMKDCFEVMSSNLTLRKSLRVRYPGACARQFDDLLQIVVSDLLGWQNGKQKDNLGIFGKILAYAIGVEEQGRTSLHAHIILWIHNYHLLQMKLFSKDCEEREFAKDAIKAYLKEVLSSKFTFSDEDNISQYLHEFQQNSDQKCRGQIHQVPLQHLREMRHIQLRKIHQGKIIYCNGCQKTWSTTEIINSVIQHLFQKSLDEFPDFWPSTISLPLKDEEIELIALRYQYDIQDVPESATNLRQLLQLVVMIFFNTHDWKHRKSCFKKGSECRFHLPQVPCIELNVRYNTDNLDNVISGKSIDSAGKWYFHDGKYMNVCGYDIQSERKPWDVFVNPHNPCVANIFGYNNNVSLGSINTLYYCTLYTSKSNQEEETYPYLKACEAVTARIKKISESCLESGLSSRQIGLRRLLSGINAHLSTCVVSATMAWYLVTHGSRFHYSHEFKPLLLSQLESWFEGVTYYRRIRYKKKQRRKENEQDNISIRSPIEYGEQSSEVWFDSDVCTYLYRPKHHTFINMSFWEFHSKYDLRTVRPKCYMDEDQNNDETEKYFRFERDHPGYLYSCLVKRDRECIPKLYYSSNFPDISSLQIGVGSNIDESVKGEREAYAKKAMLMFFPFRSKVDLYGHHDSMWESFQEQKQLLLSGISGNTSNITLYAHSIQILQNVQDLLNVKKIPNTEDILLSCTDIHDQDYINISDFNRKERDLDFDNSEAQIDLLARYVNEMTKESSTFNTSLCEKQRKMLTKLKTGVVSIQPSVFSEHILHSPIQLDSGEEETHITLSNSFIQRRTIITLLSQALDTSDVEISLHNTVGNNISPDGFPVDVSSLDAFAVKNNLDIKQALAFDAICSSFMLSLLCDPKLNISSEDREHYRTLLQNKGATDQLLMCITGPGGSGKSHVIKCCRLYCKAFCDALGKPFDFSVFPVTATSNSAASLLQGKTIHSAAMLRKSIIGVELSTEVDWTVTKVLIIDEISMASIDLFPKLDKHLRILTGNRHLLYGGIHIIFIGDFMQLAPIGGAPIFSRFNDIHWHGSLNSAIFLDQGNHRFLKDPHWGEMLKRIQLGTPTSEDLDKMNERLLTSVKLPENIDFTQTRLVYGCYTNKKRNIITDACFLNFVMCNNPIMDSNIEPSDTAILIKSYISKDEYNVGPDFHKLIWSICGDDNVDAKNNIKIDPCLRLIKGCPLMINSNVEKEKNLVKGTLGNFSGVRFKIGCSFHIEDYNGFKVLAANVFDIDCLFLMLQDNKKIVELKPEQNTVDISIPSGSSKMKIKGFKISQFAVNLSLATTGHKLQGMTKDIMILSEVSLVPNWLYVVLSRVTTLQGLFLMTPLTENMFHPIPQSLQCELDFLKDLEKRFMSKINYVLTEN